jgi:protein-tyrosine-phosphatase
VNIPDPYGEAQADPQEVVKEIIDLINGGYEKIVALAREKAGKPKP